MDMLAAIEVVVDKAEKKIATNIEVDRNKVIDALTAIYDTKQEQSNKSLISKIWDSRQHKKSKPLEESLLNGLPLAVTLPLKTIKHAVECNSFVQR